MAPLPTQSLTHTLANTLSLINSLTHSHLHTLCLCSLTHSLIVNQLLRARIRPLATYNAMLVREAVKGLGTDDAQLIEVIGTRSNAELVDMADAYDRLYQGRTLIDDVAGDTSGHYRRLLEAIINGKRPSEPTSPADIDVRLARADAESLYKAGEKRLGTDEKTFVEIFSTRSRAHLAATSLAYADRTGRSLERAIDAEFSGDLKRLLKTLLLEPVEYFAREVKRAVKG